MKMNDVVNEKSLIQTADELINAVSKIMRTAKTEEDLKIGFEKALDPTRAKLGIISSPVYERLQNNQASIFKGRPDAVHGMIVIEYEPPRVFNNKSAVEHAHNQLIDYICAEADARKDKLFLEDPRLVGVGFDGEQIFFTKYQGDKTKPKTEFDRNDFIYHGPYPFDLQSVRTLLTYLRSLSRRPLTAEQLAESFGPKSHLAPLIVSAFADSLEHWGTERVKVFFNEWKRLFGIVYGEQFSTSQQKEVEALSSLYNVSKETNFQELLFSVHTYFAFLMKLIAAELITLKETAFTSSFSEQLTHTTADELKTELEDIENGGIYAKRGITNFLEGDFFRWYLDAWSPQLEDAIREVTRKLSEFEPATSIIKPDSSRDLLKKLYQYLVPQEVRHKLGEYYTPDWLAELLINETGYDGNTLKRFLDPACGSGTFLVLAIQRSKEYGLKQKEPPLETAKRIVANIWGFDLNPLAIIAARTNYLFALGDLVNELRHLEIPVYLADSVLWPEKSGQLTLNFAGGDHAKVQTSVGEFHVPAFWLREDDLQEDIFGYKRMISKAAPLVEEMVKQNYSSDEAMKRFKKEALVFPPHEDVVKNFYNEILDLEKQGKNGIWARFLKNAFAPMIAEKFDYVVGNPPWIRWGYLSQEYRKATLPLWQNYGLFSLKGNAAQLGGGEKDFSMLFTYTAIDYYVKPEGKLGFLITQEVFKSKGAGEGFRRFRLNDKETFKVIKALDFVTVQPFEGASNKTAAIIVKKGQETTYPVVYALWSRKKGVGHIPPDATSFEALPLLSKSNISARPISKITGSWQTYSESQKGGLNSIEGKNGYQARQGADTQPYGVFLLKLKEVMSDNQVIVNNIPDSGKQKVIQVEEIIEPDLVYPALRGSDIKRWGINLEIYLLLAQDPQKREPYPEEVMRANWPRTYGYLSKFREQLLSRGSKSIKRLAERTAFYAMFGIGPYTVSKYKVVWKFMSNDITATVISQTKTPFGHKLIVPIKTVALFSLDNDEEAHYLCAVINSIPVRDFIKSFSSAGRGFGSPSVMQHVGIPKFDKSNKLHLQLADLSKELHELKRNGQEDKIPALEKQNDELVKTIFKIKK